MEIIGYGEDAMTLWALKTKLSDILRALQDTTYESQCRIFYRPSFRISGGDDGSQFGEFAFLIFTLERIYLGESKKELSSGPIGDSSLELQPEALIRHELFKVYVDEWAFGKHATWAGFKKSAGPNLKRRGIQKTIPPEGSLLAENLQTVLGIIREQYPKKPEIRDVLFYFHSGNPSNLRPYTSAEGLKVIPMDYSRDSLDNFIRINL